MRKREDEVKEKRRKETLGGGIEKMWGKRRVGRKHWGMKGEDEGETEEKKANIG